ncbi:MAG: SRPBCC family protein [Bacteroidota bacterium]
MKALKTVGFIILALLLLVVILGLIAPKEVQLQRSAVINAPQATVFSMVNELPAWERWSPWVRRDATIKNQYSDQKMGTGAYYSWTSENSGTGKLTITESFSPDSLHTFIEFDGQGNTNSNWYFEPVEGGTKTTWSFDSKFPFPFNVILLLQDVEGMVGKDYEDGLSFLKAEAESILPEGNTPTVNGIEFPATRFIGQRATVSLADLSDHFQSVMPMVGMKVAEAGAEMIGAPAALYYNWDEEQQQTDLAIVLPVASDLTVDGLDIFDIPAHNAVQADYVGNYDGIRVAHEAIDVYLAANGLTPKMPVIESYLPDPGPETETDPNKWMSTVVYLLQE